MVVDAKKQQAREFSDRLVRELMDREAPERGLSAWLARELKKRKNFNVSVTTCQKWLGGLQIPRNSHLMILCSAFDISHRFLTSGKKEPPAGVTDPALIEIIALWGSITSKDHRAHVLQTAKMAAGVIDQPPARLARTR